MKIISKKISVFLVIILPMLFMQSSQAYFNSLNNGIEKLNNPIADLKDAAITVPILVYHHFQEENIPENKYSTTITPYEFEEHLKFFQNNGYTSISFLELYNFIKSGSKLPEKPFILTIDDGYESNYTYAFPLLKKYNTKATISIVTSSVGKTPGSYPHFTWGQAKEMEQSGLVEIQNHGLFHTDHSLMSENELINSVFTAQAEIESNLGKRSINVFTYPGGNCSAKTRSILSEMGFKIQLTDFNSLAAKSADLSDIKRINVDHKLTGKDIENIIEKLKNTG